MPDALTAVLVGLAITQVAIFTTTVFLHRGLSHRALTMGAPLTAVFRVVTWLTTGINPREWVAVHRRHHAKTDEPEDPHSPAQVGWVRVQLFNVIMYRKAAKDPATMKYVRDLPEDRWDRVLFNRGLLGLGLGWGALILLVGWPIGLAAGVIHLISYIGLSAAINAVGHTFGSRPDETQSATNSQLLALVTAGEGLHNNHHARPTSARFSLHKGEFDPSWWAIRLFERLGLAETRRSRDAASA